MRRLLVFMFLLLCIDTLYGMNTKPIDNEDSIIEEISDSIFNLRVISNWQRGDFYMIPCQITYSFNRDSLIIRTEDDTINTHFLFIEPIVSFSKLDKFVFEYYIDSNYYLWEFNEVNSTDEYMYFDVLTTRSTRRDKKKQTLICIDSYKCVFF